jgi:hypothetical protein
MSYQVHLSISYRRKLYKIFSTEVLETFDCRASVWWIQSQGKRRLVHAHTAARSHMQCPKYGNCSNYFKVLNWSRIWQLYFDPPEVGSLSLILRSHTNTVPRGASWCWMRRVVNGVKRILDNCYIGSVWMAGGITHTSCTVGSMWVNFACSILCYSETCETDTHPWYKPEVSLFQRCPHFRAMKEKKNPAVWDQEECPNFAGLQFTGFTELCDLVLCMYAWRIRGALWASFFCAKKKKEEATSNQLLMPCWRHM